LKQAGIDESRRLSLSDVIHIENQLADLLGCPVDLSEEGEAPKVRKIHNHRLCPSVHGRTKPQSAKGPFERCGLRVAGING
jgi:hypothetical protein